MSKKVWNLMYVVGNPTMFRRVTAAADNPQPRAKALEGAQIVQANGWRVWVEHLESGKRIFESQAEQEFGSGAGAKGSGA